ncbi:MAG TPA: hypothetical protein VHE34_19560 [Puia sp.]|uniref:hypothetical protein n=1 Tax=Puia sp. TaxID=2045100 RepID=UPI002C8E63D4|nr:hypothetical protein [Puia sp.]HVU97438.1 hypothetical protein [Puia sp.]
MASFKTFQTFNDPGLASAIADKLKAQHIVCHVEKVEPLLEPGFFKNTVEPNIHLKVRATDLDRAHEVLEEYYEHQLQDVDPNYYLLSFTDIELLDIVAKPDEWGHFDYVLARELLAERGLPIPDETIRQMKQQRHRQLAQQSRVESFREFIRRVFRLRSPDDSR